MHDNVTNNGRITFQLAGFYLVSLNVAFASNVTGYRTLLIKQNGGIYLASTSIGATNGNDTRLFVQCASFFNLAYVVKVIVRLVHHLPPSPYPVSAPRRHPACSSLRLSSAARTPL
ncbi:MAG TPA: hypothetical protein VN228_15265 [Pyrinomonadaceae bacterium]|nr:hypothetical protein [Pyrinomonadaceae bacterium]